MPEKRQNARLGRGRLVHSGTLTTPSCEYQPDCAVANQYGDEHRVHLTKDAVTCRRCLSLEYKHVTFEEE